jgi:phage N-6-adenine-methyltransferase
MAKANVQFTKDNEYYTPKEFVKRFGVFDYDPATTKEKALDLSITNFDTIETNGLESDWTLYSRIWINPPFTIKHKFLKKAWKTYEQTFADIFILFPIEFLTTKRFQDTGAKGTIYIPNGRIAFESGLGKDSRSPAFGSVVMKMGYQNKVVFIDKKSNELVV